MLVWAMLTLVWDTPTLHILTVMAMPFHTSASPPSVFMVCLTLVSPLLLLPQRPRNNLTKPNQTKPNHVSTETTQAAWCRPYIFYLPLIVGARLCQFSIVEKEIQWKNQKKK